LSPGVRVISSKWILKNKFHPDGSLERRKARWVLRGDVQRPGIDFDQTFSPVVKPATIRTVLTLAASHKWPVHQLDVSNAFLHGELKETVYCQEPTGFVDELHPDYVCLLDKSLYGLRQAPRAWYQRFAAHLRSLGFTITSSDTSLFTLRRGSDTAWLLLYVDDIVLTVSSTALLQQIIHDLRSAFAMKDLGPLHYFLGIQVRRTEAGFFLHQQQYAEEILERAGMLNCKSASTPVDTKAKVSASDGVQLTDKTFYRSIAGALQYLTLTRPELAYAVQQACLYMHDPHDVHWNIIKRILRYVRGTTGHGVLLRASSSTALTAYTDADWAGCPDTRRSTSGFCIFLGEALISWSSKRQAVVSRSSAEAEYRGVANAAAECCWLRNLLCELQIPVNKASIIFCDNVSAVYLSDNPVHHKRTKHVELDIHFVRERTALGQLRVLHVPTRISSPIL
jgi:histone deacetylase 1/2